MVGHGYFGAGYQPRVTLRPSANAFSLLLNTPPTRPTTMVMAAAHRILSAVSIPASGARRSRRARSATSICTGWAADRLRQVLTTARVLRQPPWQALGQLGEDTGVTELTELAASMALAGTEGARVRASLSARATAMRQAATAEMETEAERASSRMALPLLVLGIGYLIFLLYPPLVGITQSL